MKKFLGFKWLNVWRVVSSVSLSLTLLLMSGQGGAAEDSHQFSSVEQQQLYQALADELRCPKCQNQNIADSNAGIAKDLRNKVYQMVTEGQSKQQIIDFMIERYGYFVYYKPPVTAGTIVLWLAPLLLALLFVVLIWLKSKHSGQSVVRVDWDSEQEAQLNRLLAQIDQDKGLGK